MIATESSLATVTAVPPPPSSVNLMANNETEQNRAALEAAYVASSPVTSTVQPPQLQEPQPQTVEPPADMSSLGAEADLRALLSAVIEMQEAMDDVPHGDRDEYAAAIRSALTAITEINTAIRSKRPHVSSKRTAVGNARSKANDVASEKINESNDPARVAASEVALTPAPIVSDDEPLPPEVQHYFAGGLQRVETMANDGALLAATNQAFMQREGDADAISVVLSDVVMAHSYNALSEQDKSSIIQMLGKELDTQALGQSLTYFQAEKLVSNPSICEAYSACKACAVEDHLHTQAPHQHAKPRDVTNERFILAMAALDKHVERASGLLLAQLDAQLPTPQPQVTQAQELGTVEKQPEVELLPRKSQ
jgi:hypothetical protein